MFWYFLQLLVQLVLAFLLGLFVGWLLWARTLRKRTQLYARKLQPVILADDRGLKEVTVDLPVFQHPHDAYLVFETDAMGSTSKDWTFWSNPEIK